MSDWEKFFDEYPQYAARVKRLASLYPEERCIVIDFDDIDEFDVDFGIHLGSKPEGVLKAGVQQMKEILEPLLDKRVNGDMRLHLRLENVPTFYKKNVRELRAEDLNTLVAIEGIARRVTEVRPLALLAAFECMRCHHITYVRQETTRMQEPLECGKEEGGCGRVQGSTKFKYRDDETKFINLRKVDIEERPEGLKGGQQPESIVALVKDDLCSKQIMAGDKVLFTGMVKAVPRNMKYTTHDVYLEVVNFNTIDAEEELKLTDEDMVAVHELAKRETLHEDIIRSIAPGIYGHETIKRAIMLQLFGGVRKGSLRGDSHILLVGDPGTAKSQILRHVSKIMPRGVYASGKSSSAAGLTACATKDEFGEGRWTLEAGALVLADGGMACVDEIDKMSEHDRSAMHDAMAQQIIQINKATIRTALQSRCSVLAAGNPKYGRFDRGLPIVEQLDIPDALWSRFDLIFPISDGANASLDAKIANHILEVHVAGQAEIRQEDMGDYEEVLKRVRPRIPLDLLRKYVFVGRSITPILSDVAFNMIKDYYVQVRGKSKGNTVSLTARQLEGLIRLSEAAAKSRLSHVVEEQDVDIVIDIMTEYLERVVGYGGYYDVDVVEGTPRTQRDVMMAMDRVLKAITGDFAYSEFLDIVEDDEKVPRDKAKAILDRWLQAGTIYHRGDGKYSKV